MRKVISLSIVVLSTLLIDIMPGYAGESAVSTMAGIMIGLKHYPGDADQQALTAILESGDSSDAEKSIATAISNIKHKVTAADKKTLSVIAVDEQTAVKLRELAAIVAATNHMPSAADIEKLQEIAGNR